jgi:polysaccharide deacetylase 2 family uncharacterized protein YibQ
VTLPGAVACAFLPHSPHTRTLANLAHAGGKPVLLHLPLEPVAGRPHPLALKTGDGSDRRTQQLATMLAAVPYARGVNNHQGSRATASHEQMHWLMRELSLRGIDYFVDSATSAASVAYPLARAYGLPATRRQVFLDNDPSPAAVRIEFERLLRIARRDGRALAIGHPHAGTLAVLRERLPQLAAEGIELITPQQLIARSRQAPAAPKPRLRLAMQLGSPTEVAQQGLAP